MEKLSAASASKHALQRLHATRLRGTWPKTNGDCGAAGGGVRIYAFGTAEALMRHYGVQQRRQDFLDLDPRGNRSVLCLEQQLADQHAHASALLVSTGMMRSRPNL